MYNYCPLHLVDFHAQLCAKRLEPAHFIQWEFLTIVNSYSAMTGSGWMASTPTGPATIIHRIMENI